jgi:hypothetical protein
MLSLSPCKTETFVSLSYECTISQHKDRRGINPRKKVTDKFSIQSGYTRLLHKFQCRRRPLSTIVAQTGDSGRIYPSFYLLGVNDGERKYASFAHVSIRVISALC